jgi:hypothetical protein
MESGIVVSQKNYYMLAVDNMEELVDLVKNNLVKTFESLKPTARSIDKRLELK